MKHTFREIAHARAHATPPDGRSLRMASERKSFVTTLHVKLCTFRQNPSPLHVSWGTSPPAGKAVSGEPKHDRKPPRLARVLGLMLAVGHLGSLDECIKRARAERAALLDSVRVVSKILKAIGEIWIRGEPVCVKVRSRVRRARGRAASPIEPTPPPQHTRHLRSLAARSRRPFCGPHIARR